MHIQINANSGAPLYRQIVDEVKAAFLKGHIKPGERLPSVRDLAATLGINPTTVVKAYDELEHQRLILCRQGQGAFVGSGDQPLHAKEREDAIADLVRKLSIEGLRLGFSEDDLIQALETELKKLRRPKEK